MTVIAGLMKCRANSSYVSSIYIVLLSFLGLASTCFTFYQILLCKSLPLVLVLLREYLFFRQTVLMLLPSQELNLALWAFFLSKSRQ